MAPALPRLPFQLAGGSVAGRMHRITGRNNQDAFAWAGSGKGLALVVSDGCGSSPHSELGSLLGARFIARTLATQLAAGQDPRLDAFWDTVRKDVLDTLLGVAGVLGGEPGPAVGDYLLFTAVGAVVTPEITVPFAAGDGVLVVNGVTTVIGPFPDNAPPYLAYALFDEEDQARYHFVRQPSLPTSELTSLVAATDGLDDLLAAEELRVPGRAEKVGPLSQLWTQDEYFENPAALSRRLAQLASDAVTPDWQERRLRTEDGLLGDDTTLIVLRRDPRPEGQDAAAKTDPG